MTNRKILYISGGILVQVSHSVMSDFATPWTAAHQASLSITNSQSFMEFMSIESVMPSIHLILCRPIFLLPLIFPSIRFFSMSQFLASGGQSIGASASAADLPMNIQDWFPLGFIGWISLQSKGLSRVFQHHSSKASILRHSAFFTVQLTSIHDHWKNHSIDYMELCWQSNVSAFEEAV